METVCIKIATLIDADALKVYLEGYDIPAIVTPYPEGMVTTLGGETLAQAVLVRQEDLGRVVQALRAEENDLLTPEELALLTGDEDAGPDDDVTELLEAYKDDVEDFVKAMSGDDEDEDYEEEEEDDDQPENEPAES